MINLLLSAAAVAAATAALVGTGGNTALDYTQDQTQTMTVTLAGYPQAQTMTVSQNSSGKWRLVVAQGEVNHWDEINTVFAEMRNHWDIPITWGTCTGREVSCINVTFYSADDGAAAWGSEGMVKFNLRADQGNSLWRREVVWHEFGHAFGLPHNDNPVDKCRTSMAGGCEHSHGWYVYGYTPAEYQKVQRFLSR